MSPDSLVEYLRQRIRECLEVENEETLLCPQFGLSPSYGVVCSDAAFIYSKFSVAIINMVRTLIFLVLACLANGDYLSISISSSPVLYI